MPDRMQVVDQIYDRSRLLQPEHSEDHANLALEALQSAAYSGLQAPIKGATQLADKVLGTNMASHVKIVDTPRPAEFGSGAWHAQQIGGALGMIGPFLAVNASAGALMGTEGVAAETLSLRTKVTQAALAGGLYEGVFRPVEENEGNFWTARIRHATVGAATFATLTATAHGLDRFGKTWMKDPLDRDIMSHAYAGVVAGGSNAQLESLLSGKGFASTEDTVRGSYTFAMLGFGMKGVKKIDALFGWKPTELRGNAPGRGARYIDAITSDHARTDASTTDHARTDASTTDRARTAASASEAPRKDGAASEAGPRDGSTTDAARSQKWLREDLKDVPVRTETGAVTDVYDKIASQPDSVLAPEQKARILGVLGDTRDSLLKIDGELEPGAKNKGYQVVNWKHTRGEIDQVLEASKLNPSMTPVQTENAILASIISDSVKTPENFIRHHVDAANHADKVLSKYFDSSNPADAVRIAEIKNAILEHQIGPPGFMGFMTQMTIRNSIKGEMANGAKQAFGEKMPEAEQKVYDGLVARLMKPVDGPLSTEERAFMQHIGVDAWKVEESKQINSLQGKISKPFENQVEGSVNFNATENAYMNQIGLSKWYVPEKGTPWYDASRAVIDGDSLINYASPDGWAKIGQIRGPGTIFKDATIWDSLASAKASYNDAFSVMTDAAKPLGEAGLRRTEAAVERVKPEVQKWINANKAAYGYGADEKVSFWDKDAAPLKYPEDGHPLEAQDALRLDFARQIRDRMVAELRAQQGNYSEKP